jgi:hypothetical protein
MEITMHAYLQVAEDLLSLWLEHLSALVHGHGSLVSLECFVGIVAVDSGYDLAEEATLSICIDNPLGTGTPI